MIDGLDEALTDQALLRRAILDAGESVAKYFTYNRSTGEAIQALNTLATQFDEARIDHRERLRRRSDA
jgi:hypothetical protein